MEIFLLAIIFLIVLLINFLISRVGWLPLYNHLEEFQKEEFKGIRIGISSLSINDFSYSSCVVIFVNNEGMLLKPFFLLKPSHPNLFIPWSEFKEVSKKLSQTKARKYKLGDRSQFTIYFQERLCVLIEQKVGNVFFKKY